MELNLPQKVKFRTNKVLKTKYIGKMKGMACIQDRKQ